MSKKARVIVGLSGGVDSTVSAYLLKQQGYEVIGLFMKNWEDDDDGEYCPYKKDLQDVIAISDQIGIDVEGANFAQEYRDRVFSYFLKEYQAGRTPNPDILCNSEIKFDVFLKYAMTLGADFIATGHYAQVRAVKNASNKTSYQLLKAEDGTKDQSYFLYRLNQEQLAQTIFPLGKLYKREVRQIAQEQGFVNYAKKDSTGICFIGERPFREFLERYLPKTPGQMVTPEGKPVGTHQGLAYYTIGQRQGLGIGGAGDPWYVVQKDMHHNQLIVAQGHDHPALYRHTVEAEQMHWISGELPLLQRVLSAKNRYRQSDQPCTIHSLEKETGTFSTDFAEPQWAITSGQSIVVYDSQVCLGGGIIR